MSDLATLVVKLRAEISEYTAGLKSATAEVQGFAKNVDDSIKFVTKAFASLFILKQAFNFGKEALDNAAKFDVLSHSVGIAADQLAQLTLAAKLDDVGDLTSSLEKLSKSAGNVAMGNEEAAAAYRALGVSVTDSDGKLKSTQQLFYDVADAISKYKDGIAKTRIEQVLFGRSGAEMTAFLDKGGEEIKRIQKLIHDLGADPSPALAAASQQFQDNMILMGAAVTGLKNKILEELLPALNDLSDYLIQSAVDARASGQSFDPFVTAIKYAIGFVLSLLEALNLAGQTLKLFYEYTAIVSSGLIDLGNAFLHPIEGSKKLVENFKQHVKDIEQTQDNMTKGIQTLGGALHILLDDNNKGLAKVADTSKKLKDLNLPDDKTLKATESAIESLVKLNNKLEEQVATFGLSKASALAYSLTLGDLAAQVQRLDHLPLGQAETALKNLLKQGKITTEQFEEYNAKLRAGVKLGDDFKDKAIAMATALDHLGSLDAFTKINTQLLTVTGHLNEVQKLALDLANRPIRITIADNEAKNAIAGITDEMQKQIVLLGHLGLLGGEAIRLKQEEQKAIEDVIAAGEREGKTDDQILEDKLTVTSKYIQLLQELKDKAEAFFKASSGDPLALKQVQAIADIYNEIADKAGPEAIRVSEHRLALEQEFNSVLTEQRRLEDELGVTFSKLNAARAEGTINDIQLMNAQDAAVEKQIENLEQQLEQFKELKAVSGESAEVYSNLDSEISRTEQSINNLKATTHQLARAIRDDFEQTATDAFVSFVNGTQSASKAFHQFLRDIETRLLQRAAENLFQSIFGDLFSSLTGAAGGVAGSTAKGTAEGAAAGAAISTAVITSGATAAGLMAQSISAAGIVAGTEMASAITAAAAANTASTAVLAIPHAAGGPVSSGVPYLVGEAGPELMVPDTGGTIVPNGQWGGGIRVTNHFHISAPQGTVSRATQAQIAAAAAASVAAAGARNN